MISPLRHRIVGSLGFIFALAPIGTFADVLRVDKSVSAGSGDGSSWANAFAHLQDALEAAASDDEIWVAEGVYYPDEGANRLDDDPSSVFEMRAGTSIYGGFNGTEQDRSERDPENHRTILSGDIDGNDLDPDADSIVEDLGDQEGSNSAVLRAASAGNVTLDGLVVTGGNSDSGGGFLLQDSTAMIAQCTFVGNFAGHGGAVALDGLTAQAEISECEFRGNGASQEGGGIHSHSDSIITVAQCRFTNNRTHRGGGISAPEDSVVSVTDSEFFGNGASDGGGGIYAIRAQLTLRGCRFETNKSKFSGGPAILLDEVIGFSRECEFIANESGSEQFPKRGGVFLDSSSFDFVGCRFERNVADKGAGVYALFSDSRIQNCSFLANQAALGAGIMTFQSTLALTNCVLAGNSALNGAAIYTDGPTGTLVNCTLSGNAASRRGGAIYRRSTTGDPLVVRNSIFWKNSADGLTDTPSATAFQSSAAASDLHFSHSIVANSGGSASWNTELGADLGNNLDLDPLFLIPANPPDAPISFSEFDLRPRIDSPAVNAGDNSALNADLLDLDDDGDLAEIYPIDGDGRPRIVDLLVDIGAKEISIGPALVAIPEPLRIEPNSGSHIGAIGLANLFDQTAVRFSLVEPVPGEIIAGRLDPSTGMIDFDVAPDRIGRTYLTVSAEDETGAVSLITVIIDVFPQVVFVDRSATGTGNGLTWQDAFPFLQDALAIERISGVSFEYWVAAGTYFPDEGAAHSPDDPEAVFALPPDARLYGGFRGDETHRDQRNPARSPSILSGDIDQDDIDLDGNPATSTPVDQRGVNSRHVLSGSGTVFSAVLDGFVITAAAEGAMLNEDAHIEVIDCLFAGARGGAVRNVGGTVRFVGCRFLNNLGEAGGALSADATDIAIVQCEFVENSAAESPGGLGGAVSLWEQSVATIQNCRFLRNHAPENGGALYARSAAVVVRDCEFVGNHVFGEGGGIFLQRSSARISGCTFLGNQANRAGGALYDTIPSEGIALSSCRFMGNSAGGGGAVLIESGPPAVINNSLFAQNSATSGGGALVAGGGRSLDLTNCTFVGNYARHEGGALKTTNDTTLSNCIVWNNSVDGSTTEPESSVHISRNDMPTYMHSLIANSGGSAAWDPDLGTDGGNNLDVDPRLLETIVPPAAPAPNENAVGSAFLDAGSPAIESGLNVAVAEIPFDLTGRARISGSHVDLGAYEAHGDELDSDDDGLSDAFERTHTSPPSATALVPIDDPDKDGIPTLLEFALGLHPLQAEAITSIRPVIVSEAGENYFALTYRQNVWATKYLSFFVERSTDLGERDPWGSGQTTALPATPLDSFTSFALERSNSPLRSQSGEQLRLRVQKK